MLKRWYRRNFTNLWFIRDGCGIVCAVITWMLVVFAEFVVSLVLLDFSEQPLYSLFNWMIFTFLATLALSSHFKSMTTDPGAVPIGLFY